MANDFDSHKTIGEIFCPKMMWIIAVIVPLSTPTLATSLTDSVNNTTCSTNSINNHIQVFTTPRSSAPIATQSSGPRDCAEVQASGHTVSGRYTVHPDDGGFPFLVYCDMETSGGGWTVFQRRQDGIIDFYRSWLEYENGFGPVIWEHWLGNEKIHRLTTQKRYTLRVDLWDWEGGTVYAEYDLFILLGEDTHYRLIVKSYHGDAGNSLGGHNGQPFTTLDADHDNNTSNCAQSYKGGWWYEYCHSTNLNGLYLTREASTSENARGITWWNWKRGHYPLKASEMKLRPSST